jgi:hypothetical protein
MSESDPEFQKLHKYVVYALSIAFLIVFLVIAISITFLLELDIEYMSILLLFEIFILFLLVFLLIIVLRKHKILQADYLSTKFEDSPIGEVKAWLVGKPSDPNKLVWKKYNFFSRMLLGDILRIRIKVTNENVSNQLLNIYANTTYNYIQEPPEIISLLDCFSKALDLAGLKGNSEKSLDEGELKGDFIKYFEPYVFHIPFEKITLHLAITLDEFQWNLVDSSKEPENNVFSLETFKENLLEQSRIFVKNNNRLITPI